MNTMRPVLLALVAAILLPGSAAAQCCNHDVPPIGAMRAPMLGVIGTEICSKGMTFQHELGLSKAQIDKLSGLRKTYREALVATVAAAMRNHAKLKKILITYPIDAKAATTSVARAAALTESLNTLYISLCTQASEVFTEEQEKKFQALEAGEAKMLGLDEMTKE